MCKNCEGWGCVEVNGKWEYCSCPAGFDLAYKVPGYIDFCNSLKGKPKRDGLLKASETVAGVIAGKQMQTAQVMREPGEDAA